MPRIWRADTPVSQVGERGLLEAIAPHMAPAGGRVLVGMGDDAAVVSHGADGASLEVLTTDMMVEGTHFLRGPGTDWERLGRKAVASNVSDVASMAARPGFALVSLGVPGDLPLGALLDLYAGLGAECRRWGVALVGGDTVFSPVMVLNVALTGSHPAARPVPLRSRCRAGQSLYLSGHVGASRAGLALLTDAAAASLRAEPWAAALLGRHLAPEPRVALGMALGAALDDLAMIDISDSVMNELRLLAEASGAGMTVEMDALPVSRETRAFCAARGADAVPFALSSGEEYELMFATASPPEAVAALLARAGVDTPVTRIGSVAEGGGVRFVDAAGAAVAVEDSTFSHFR